ncbi:MAG: hypothetical protein ACYDBZ_16950 [Steroidobacteraceae bacterium]
MRTAVRRLNSGAVPVERITGSILVLRGHRVLLDSNLADLYGVATKFEHPSERAGAPHFSYEEVAA